MKNSEQANSSSSDSLSGMISCPVCDFVAATAQDVTSHVDREHFGSSPQCSSAYTSSPKRARTESNGEVSFSPVKKCPVCGAEAVSVASREGKSLQFHVEAHFGEAGGGKQSKKVAGADGRSSDPLNGYEHVEDGDESSEVLECTHSSCRAKVPVVEWNDHLLAHDLMAEEDRTERDRKDLEEKELEQLKRQYGMDCSSSFAKQYGRQLHADVQCGHISGLDYHSQCALLAEQQCTGVDDGSTSTRGVLVAVGGFYTRNKPRGLLRHVFCKHTVHMASGRGDFGWGCGYRNLQMLLSSLLEVPEYAALLRKKLPTREGGGLPSIPCLQQFIQDAWSAGFDRQGAAQLGCRLVGTCKWIGATEVAAMLRWMGLRAMLVDFHSPTGQDGTHPTLFEWFADYFWSNPSPRLRSDEGAGGSAAVRSVEKHGLEESRCQGCVYLQHQGHSRSVVGIEQRSSGYSLVVFDPSHSKAKVSALLSTSLTPSELSARLQLLRRTVKQLKCHQYQVVYIDGVYDETERDKSKILTSRRIPAS